MLLLHGNERSAARTVASGSAKVPDIRVVRQTTVKGFYLTVPFDDAGKIQAAFRMLYPLSQAEDSKPELYSLLTPHLRKTYRAFIVYHLTGHGFHHHH